MSKEINKTQFVPLRTKEDCVVWLEKTINDVKETPTSIALANNRTSTVKARSLLERQHLEYLRFRDKSGSSVTDQQAFFAAIPGQRQLEKR